MTTDDHDSPAIVGAGITCSIGSHAPTVITSLAAGLARIQSVDQPDVRRDPIVVAVARDEANGTHHVLSLLTRSIRALLEGGSSGLEVPRTIEILIGWPDPMRPGAPSAPDLSALADGIGSRLGSFLGPERVHLITGASAGARALAAARDRMSDSPEIDACLVAAADSWLTVDAMRWAASRRPLRRSVLGDGMVPAEAGAALWLVRQAASTSARLVGAAVVNSTEGPHSLDLAVRTALAQSRLAVDDVAHLVLDTDCERDSIAATAVMSRGVGHGPWLGTRWFPTESIGNVGAAAGLVQVMLASHLLTRHGEGGAALCITCAGPDQPAALVLSAPSSSAASLEEPISWAL